MTGTSPELFHGRWNHLQMRHHRYRTNIKWLWKHKFPIITLLASAYKQGKPVYVSVHPMRNVMYAESIVDSLTFE